MTDGNVLFYSFNGFQVSTGYFVICLTSALIAFFIVTLNGVVIQTIICNRKMKTISDYFLSCLAMSDLVTGLMLLYITSYSLFQYQILTECLFRFGQSHGILASSTLHRAAFTADRFIKIIFPLHYFKVLNKTAVAVVSTLTWITSLIIGLLPLLGWRNEISMDINGHLTCRYFGILTTGYLAFVESLLVSVALVMGILYIVIFYVARKQANSIAAQLGGLKTSKSYLDKHSLKLAKTICIVVGVSNICWLPTFFVVLFHLTGTLDNMSAFQKGQIITYCSTTVFLNSLINPVIYALKITPVKNRFRGLLAKYRDIFLCKRGTVVHPVTIETITSVK